MWGEGRCRILLEEVGDVCRAVEFAAETQESRKHKRGDAGLWESCAVERVDQFWGEVSVSKQSCDGHGPF